MGGHGHIAQSTDWQSGYPTESRPPLQSTNSQFANQLVLGRALLGIRWL